MTKLLLLFVLACARCVAAETPLPVEAIFLPGLMELHYGYEVWSEMTFPLYGGKLHSGKHWIIEGPITEATQSSAAWKTLKAAFLAKGWTLEWEFPDFEHFGATLHYTQNRVEAWANIAIPHPADIRIDMLEASPVPYALVLSPPKSRTDRLDPAKGDFPYATPLPGSEPGGSKWDAAPFLVTLAGASQPELISIGSTIKSYPKPDGMSGELFVVEYRTALTKAGWAIANESKGADDPSVLAHYTQHGRNLWIHLRWNNDNYQIQVAEAGAKNLGKRLSANCHVALSGLLFDFNETASEVPLKDGSSPLTISPLEINGDPGETETFTAATTTTVPGAFGWRMAQEAETDDLTAFTLVASSCAGHTTCTAKLVSNHPGFVSLQVAFHPASSTQIMQADSAPVLRQALALLKKHRSLRVEVQGHTDNVGTDAYNQTLSDARAAAVVAWLTQHGIAAGQLTSKGYGKAKPVAGNGDDEGRSTNRRIEIADPRCVPKVN